MQTLNAIKRLQAKGWNLSDYDLDAISELIFATKGEDTITFANQSGKVKSNGFSIKSTSSCSETFGMNLKTALLCAGDGLAR